MSKIPDIFCNNDTIFHYCKTSTAIENILFDKKLRLTPRKESNDPIENKIIKIFDSIAAFPEDIEQIEKNTNLDVEKLQNDIISRINNIRQVCFCKNPGVRKINNYEIPKENFGFLKPRMWNQYAANYEGVCLAFSKSKLLENNKIELKNKVKYLTYISLENQYIELDRNELLKIGYKNYNKDLKRFIDKIMFRKHRDYRDENEYRICTLSEDNYDYISIDKSIRGIIFSPNHNNRYSYDKLKEYSKKLEIELMYITWNNNGVNFDSELHSPNVQIIFKHKIN